MTEYQLKLLALQEYTKALEYKKAYEDILEAFRGLIEQAYSYYRENGMDVPDEGKLLRIVEKADELIQMRVTATDLSHEDDFEGSNRRRHRTPTSKVYMQAL